MKRVDEPIRHVSGLSTRTAFALCRHGITSVAQLDIYLKAGSDPRDIRGIGAIGYRDICQLMGIKERTRG